MSDHINELLNAHKAGYAKGKKEGFNEALEEVKKVFSPVFQIAPSAENIIPIMEAFKKSFEEIEKLKR